MKTRWISLAGDVSIGDAELIFSPPTMPDGVAGSGPPPRARLRSNRQFDSGSVEFEFKLDDPAGEVALQLRSAAEELLLAGVNLRGVPYSILVHRELDWKVLAATGQGSRVTPGEWHQMRLQVDGARIGLFMDTVQVADVLQQVSKAPLELILASTGLLTVRQVDVRSVAPMCFVVMQFTDEYNTLYREVIEPTCAEFGYRVVRADEFHHSGLIIRDITQSIARASLVIADITPDNPNVYYELGFAHGAGTETILLSERKRAALPFDVSGFRTLFYDNSIGGKRKVEEGLRSHLRYMAQCRGGVMAADQPPALAS